MVEKNELRDKGLRLTPQRELVLRAVRDLGHATPEEIAAKIHRTHPGINLSTVYRNLETLENVGFVQHTHLGHGGATYASTEVLEHFHLTCSVCGTVTEAPLKDAEEFIHKMVDSFGFHPDITHFAIYGICVNCSALAK